MKDFFIPEETAKRIAAFNKRAVRSSDFLQHNIPLDKKRRLIAIQKITDLNRLNAMAQSANSIERKVFLKRCMYRQFYDFCNTRGYSPAQFSFFSGNKFHF